MGNQDSKSADQSKRIKAETRRETRDDPPHAPPVPSSAAAPPGAGVVDDYEEDYTRDIVKNDEEALFLRATETRK